MTFFSETLIEYVPGYVNFFVLQHEIFVAKNIFIAMDVQHWIGSILKTYSCDAYEKQFAVVP